MTVSVTRGTALSGYVELARDVGAVPEQVLREARVDPAAIGQYERVLTYQQVATVIGSTAERANCPDFAMRLAKRQGLDILGPLAVVIRHSATFAEAMDAVGRYLFDIAPADVVELRRAPTEAVFLYDMTIRNLPYREHVIEKALVTSVSAFRVILGADFVPTLVTLRHEPIAPETVYEAVFGCPVRFRADDYEFHLPRDVLDRPVGGHDFAALHLAENYLTSRTPHTTLTDHVGDVIGKLLGLDRAGVVPVAKALGLHPRVLQRKLAAENTTFEQILDNVRRTKAWDLAASDLSAAQISRLLGYSEQSSYARACRRWFGESPRQLAARRRTLPLNSRP